MLYMCPCFKIPSHNPPALHDNITPARIHPDAENYAGHVSVKINLTKGEITFNFPPRTILTLTQTWSESHPISPETTSKHAAPGNCAIARAKLTCQNKHRTWRAATNPRLARGRGMSRARAPAPASALRAHFFSNPLPSTFPTTACGQLGLITRIQNDWTCT